MKKFVTQTVSILLIAVLMLGIFPIQEAHAASSPEDIIVSIATAEYKAKVSSGLKYCNWFYKVDKGGSIPRESLSRWCAIFVAWCAWQAGINTNVIPQEEANAGCGNMYRNIISCGGKVVPSPQAGDLVFYFAKSSKTYAHVGIMINDTQSIHGNLAGKVDKALQPDHFILEDGTTNYDIIYVRPNYVVASPDGTVITQAATNITPTSAQLNGYLIASRDVEITEHGAYLGTSTSNMTLVAKDSGKTYKKSSLSMYYDTAKYGTTLQPNTTYYYYQYAVVNGKTQKGSVVSFKTPSIPVVTTLAAKSITQTNAEIQGTVSKDSSVSLETSGFYFGTSSSSLKKVVTFSVDKSANAANSGKSFDISCNMNTEAKMTLSPGTTYYYQCYVTYQGKEYKGAVSSFTTEKPTSSTTNTNQNIAVTTLAAKSITQTNAEIQGMVSKDSSVNLETSGFYLGTSSSNLKKVVTFSVDTSANAANNGKSFDISCDVNDEAKMTLTPGTTYYYQCYVTYQGKEYKGAVSSFTTEKATSSTTNTNQNIAVTTLAAKSITQTNAEIQGTVSKDSSVNLETSGFYLGTSSSNLKKVVTFSVDTSANAANNGKSFDISCDMNDEAKMALTPGTTYYYQCYVTYQGKEYKGTVSSFTTAKDTSSTTNTNQNIAVTTLAAKSITQTNAVVQGTVSKDSSVNLETSGFYLGTSSGNLKKVVTFSVDTSANTYRNGKGFDISCDMNDEAKMTLTPGTTYYYQCYVTYQGKEYKGAVSSFTTEKDTSSTTSTSQNIAVTTLAAKSITQTNAVIQGTVSKDSSVNLETSGFYLGTSSGNLKKVVTFSVDTSANTYRNGKGFDISCDMNDEAKMTLTPGTTYYYQCYVTYQGKEYKGAVSSFTTAKDTSSTTSTSQNIAVTTLAAKNITQTNAVIQGTVSKDSSVNLETSGFYLGTSSSNLKKVVTFSVDTSANTYRNGKGFDISCDMNAEAKMTLSPGTTYYYQCYVTYQGKEYKGAVSSFATEKDTSPNIVVTTLATKSITGTNAVVQGTVSKDSSVNLETSGFYFGTSSSNLKKVVTFSVDTSANAYRNGKGFDISCDMNDEAKMTLTPGTTYYYQCYVTYQGKEYKGAVSSFTTGR